MICGKPLISRAFACTLSCIGLDSSYFACYLYNHHATNCCCSMSSTRGWWLAVWGHFLPFASSDIHDVHIACSAGKADTCQGSSTLICMHTRQKGYTQQTQCRCNSSPAVEAGPGEAGGASPRCEPSSAVAPPAGNNSMLCRCSAGSSLRCCNSLN